jgi:hypothetical protein
MSDPELTPDQDDQIRRLLASARHDAPVPADVVQRLDRVLDQLGAGGDLAPVVDLAARRHRRRQASQVVLAAAAVVAVGFGVAHLSTNGAGGDNNAADSSAVAGRQAQSGARSPGQERKGTTAPRPSMDSAASPLAADGLQAVFPFQLRDQRFGHDVRRAVRSAAMLDAGVASSPGYSTKVPLSSCPAADYGTGTLIPVVYRGANSILAVRSDQAGKLVVDVLACGTATVLHSATVPAR